MSLLLLFQYSDETLTYFNFKVVEPDRRNQVLGLMNPKGTTYCRVCIDRLKIPYVNIKYITYKHTLQHKDYICINCGFKITKEVIENRYWKVNKIGKNRRWN